MWGKWSPALLCKLSVVGHAEVFQFSVNGFEVLHKIAFSSR